MYVIFGSLSWDLDTDDSKNKLTCPKQFGTFFKHGRVYLYHRPAETIIFFPSSDIGMDMQWYDECSNEHIGCVWSIVWTPSFAFLTVNR